jgi:hypothetical protein
MIQVKFVYAHSPGLITQLPLALQTGYDYVVPQGAGQSLAYLFTGCGDLLGACEGASLDNLQALYLPEHQGRVDGRVQAEVRAVPRPGRAHQVPCRGCRWQTLSDHSVVRRHSGRYGRRHSGHHGRRHSGRYGRRHSVVRCHSGRYRAPPQRAPRAPPQRASFVQRARPVQPWRGAWRRCGTSRCGASCAGRRAASTRRATSRRAGGRALSGGARQVEATGT